jgi:hypothetical protein
MKNAHVISQVEPKRVKDLQNGSQLPTIDEGEIEQDTIDFSKLGQKNVPQSRLQSKRNVRVPSSVKTGAQVVSQRANYQSEVPRNPNMNP